MNPDPYRVLHDGPDSFASLLTVHLYSMNPDPYHVLHDGPDSFASLLQHPRHLCKCTVTPGLSAAIFLRKKEEEKKMHITTK